MVEETTATELTLEAPPAETPAVVSTEDLYYPTQDQIIDLTYRAGNYKKTCELIIKPVTDKVLEKYVESTHSILRAANEMIATTSNALSLDAVNVEAQVALFNAVCPTNRDLPDETKIDIVRQQILFTAMSTPIFETEADAAGYPADSIVVRVLVRFNNVPVRTEHIFRYPISAQDRKDYDAFGGKTIFGANTKTGQQDIVIVAKPRELKALYERMRLEHRGYESDQFADVPLHHRTAALQELFKTEAQFSSKNG